METLYLMIPPHQAADGRGQFWPPAGWDPARTDLVAFEADMDGWGGDDMVAATTPWFLASARLCGAISAAALTGLRVGVTANVTYSDAGEVLASLGELAAKDVPPVPPGRATKVLGPGRLACGNVTRRAGGSGWEPVAD